MAEKMSFNQKLEVLSDLKERIDRLKFSHRLGKTHESERDLYKELGYPLDIDFHDYYLLYKRQDIAKRIVNARPDATWRLKPIVEDGDVDSTEFEDEWRQLVKDKRLYHYFSRVDRLAGVGRYGILVLGFDDGKPLNTPVERASKLLYLQVFSQGSAEIKTINEERSSPNFGSPELYRITSHFSDETRKGISGSFEVHASRVIHVSEGLLENDIYGTPRLECVFNRLRDLEKIAGGSAEMFWRGAYPGLGLEAEADTEFDSGALEDAEEQVDAYIHKLRRYIALQGISVNQLSPQVADPSNHVDVQMTMISGATGIPKRILIGSERGELASSQDETNWNAQIQERRETFAEPIILRPFIDKLVNLGVLPKPKDGYTVNFPDLDAPSDKEKADIANTRTATMKQYADGFISETLMTPQTFLHEIMGFDKDRAEEIAAEIMAIADEEDDEIDTDTQAVNNLKGNIKNIK